MSFLHPYYLWALAGLAVPIAIHLWSKKEAKTIKIGSVQLLSESKSKQSSSIELNEWWLLVVRMLLISIVVLLMAKPQWSNTIKNSEITYLLESGLSTNVELMQFLDSVSQEEEVRLLERNFPVVTDFERIDDTAEIPDYWQLASEMDALNTDSIVVFTTGLQRGLKGMRTQTENNINWVVMDSDTILEKGLLAYKNTEGLELVSIISTSNLAQFRKEQIDSENSNVTLNSNGDSLQINARAKPYSVPVMQLAPIQVELFYADSLSTDKKYIEAAFEALSSYLGRKISVESKSDSLPSAMDNSDLTIWLSAKPTPDSYQKPLLYKQDSLAQDLITIGALENTFLLTNRLTIQNSTEQRLTEKLLVLLNLDSELNPMVSKWDSRKVPESVLKTTYVKEQNKKVQRAGIDSSPWLWAGLCIVMIAERILAFKRKQ
ncbi:MAG: BatA domain-containing protein [Maribacter sp.]